MARECGPPSSLRVPQTFRRSIRFPGGYRVARTTGSPSRRRDGVPRPGDDSSEESGSIRLVELGGRKPVGPVAEFAGDGDHPILRHVVALAAREAGQHVRHPLARARASGLDAGAAKYPHAALMEEAIEQSLAR